MNRYAPSVERKGYLSDYFYEEAIRAGARQGWENARLLEAAAERASRAGDLRELLDRERELERVLGQVLRREIKQLGEL